VAAEDAGGTVPFRLDRLVPGGLRHEGAPGLERLGRVGLEARQPVEDARVLERATDEEDRVLAQEDVELGDQEGIAPAEGLVGLPREDDAEPVLTGAVEFEETDVPIRRHRSVLLQRLNPGSQPATPRQHRSEPGNRRDSPAS
jgi:hypothetical protein